MAFSLLVRGSVMTIAVTSVAIMGAGLAPAVLVSVLNWRRTPFSLVAAMVSGIAVAITWKMLGASAIINEAAPGILAGITVNFACSVASVYTTKGVSGRGDQCRN